MSCGMAESVSRVRYSVRNCWSTEMPNRYSLVAPSGMARVTTENAERNTTAAPRRSTGGSRRHAQPAAKCPPSQANWPTVVSACSWLLELNAGHSTREIAARPMAAMSNRHDLGGHFHLADDPRRTGQRPGIIRWGACGRSAADEPHHGHQVRASAPAPRRGPCPWRPRATASCGDVLLVSP